MKGKNLSSSHKETIRDNRRPNTRGEILRKKQTTYRIPRMYIKGDKGNKKKLIIGGVVLVFFYNIPNNLYLTSFTLLRVRQQSRYNRNSKMCLWRNQTKRCPLLLTVSDLHCPSFSFSSSLIFGWINFSEDVKVLGSPTFFPEWVEKYQED